MPKSCGQHPINKLNFAKIKSLNTPGRYADGNGLYLVVDPSGAKRWVLRTIVMQRRRDMGLGGFQLITLSEARVLATQYRKIARQGGDPIAERAAERRVVLTFKEAAEAIHKERKDRWENTKHANQWINTLKTYVFPKVGSRRLNQLGTADVRDVLATIWLTKPETARRVKQRMKMVFDWAKASEMVSGANPVDTASIGLGDQPKRDKHHKAMDYDDVRRFVSKLKNSDASIPVKLGFELLILTASRTSEIVLAQWAEFDLDNAVWTVPAARMKMRKEHRHPLTERSVNLLREAKAIQTCDYVFAGHKLDRPISNMAFLMTMRRMQEDATPHGFRSSFRDWASETTSYPHAVCEMALAHTIANKSEAAYRRGDLFEKRRELMDDWAKYIIDTGEAAL
jgi:integrase